MRADLHTHSTASDGTTPPAELPALAAAAGLDLIALTDHDGYGGIAAADGAARKAGVRLLPGAELSCASGGGVRLHLLAYGADPLDSWLAEHVEAVRNDRIPRARRIVDSMRAAGLPITWDEVAAAAGANASIGRPHLAAVLVANGAATDIADAFNRFLADDAPYYAGHLTLDATAAVGAVRAAGGVPVLAHARAKRGPQLSEDEIVALADAGLAGLEVEHPDHDEADRARLHALAGRLGLLTTGSSDFHGAHKEGLELGANTTDPDQLDALLDQITGAPLLGAGAGANAVDPFRDPRVPGVSS